MTQNFREVHRSDLAGEIEGFLHLHFKQLLSQRGPGHCMRVPDLDDDLMRRLAIRLQSDSANCIVRVLASDAATNGDNVYVTSTKLIELRNPDVDGILRAPLLVFVPNELRTSSEDSFGIATFEDVSVSNVYDRVNERLLNSVPVTVRSSLQAVLQLLREHKWQWAISPAISRFLLTVKLNEYDPDVVGAALFELGLIPDFKFLADPAKVYSRTLRNMECVQKLVSFDKPERLRVIGLGLEKRAFRAELANFLVDRGLENPCIWARQIVQDRSNWRFTFDKWEFEDSSNSPEQVFVEVVSTNLPRVSEDNTDSRLQGLVGNQILPLGKGGIRQFSVTFRVDPAPSRVEGLAKFRLLVVSADAGPTGVVKSVSVWKTATSQKTVAFSKLTGIDWEEGWHFVRIQALTESGDVITLLGHDGTPLRWKDESSSDQTQAPNESAPFYVVPEGEVDVEPIQRAIQRYPSLTHAQRSLQFSAVLDDRDPTHIVPTETTWSDRSRSSSQMVEVKFGGEGTIHIPVSSQLKAIEERALSEPATLGHWRVSINRGTVGQPVSEPIVRTKSVQWEDLLSARQALFEAIQQGERKLIAQANDFTQLRDLITTYGGEYQSVLQTLLRRFEVTSGSEQISVRTEIEGLLCLDVVFLTLTNYRGQRQQAAMVGPLHPLRCLWLAGWTSLGEDWVSKAIGSRQEFVAAARDVLLERLLPSNHPPFLSAGQGRVFTAVDNIHPLWTLYAPSLERDPRGLIGNVCSALGIPEPDIGGLTVTGQCLANRIQRYLIQHPYVKTLSINAFNPGRAHALAEMLAALQLAEAFQNIRYDIRLFVPDANAPGVGEGLLSLLNPDAQVSAQLADVFSQQGFSHLSPKLRVAIRPSIEFRSNPDQYQAHLSLLFDIFPAEEVSAGRTRPEDAGAPVHGLIQDFVVHYTDDADAVAWTRQPRHGLAEPIERAEAISDLLSSLPTVYSNATATVATGQAGTTTKPQITLALNKDDRALIHQVHEVSDWVFTIDRNVGIEYFDHNNQLSRPDYLIEHTPGLENGLGHQVLITSRSLVEIEAMMRSVLERFSLPADGQRAAGILDSLRCLSGRLALKLISSPSQRAEALGLALAKIYLSHQGVFEDQIVVPLDAHLELYREPRRHAEQMQDEVSLKRTDLALFDLNAAERVITCNLVEVKCYSSTGSLSAYAQLKDNVVEQLQQSEKILRQHFDTTLHNPDRIDRVFKTVEFCKLLEFYLDRSTRFGMLSEDAAEEGRFFLRTLEDGYQLKFTRSALICDFEKNGSERETDNAVEFYRIGADIVRTMLDQLQPGDESTGSDDGGGEADESSSSPKGPASEMLASDAGVPRLSNAAFLARDRDRSVSWDSLASRTFVTDRSKPLLSMKEEAVVGSGEESRDKKQIDETPSIQKEQPPAVDLRLLSSEYHVTPTEGVSKIKEGNVPPDDNELSDVPAPAYDVLLGSTNNSPQYGILGEVAGRKVALDLNQTQTMSLFGVQGAGKSYTLGAIAEMATMRIEQINALPNPLATVIFHYSPTQDYRPEFTSMAEPNTDAWAIEVLKKRFGAEPKALKDVVLLVPRDKLEQRRLEYPSLAVHPLCFSSSELQVSHWQFLLGAVGNQAVYIRQLKSIMRGLRHEMTLASLQHAIDSSSMPDNLKNTARTRLDLAAAYIDDSAELSTLLRPGRMIVVDLRDEFIEKDEALGLFVMLLQLFGDAKYQGRSFNKLIVFDEAHKYIDNPDLVAGLIEVVREMRHKGTSILVASQDPPSVPISLIELSTQIIMHRFNSPAWLKHIQKANAALNSLTPEKMSQLRQGEAFVWSSKATDEAFQREAMKIQCRPRVTLHGGGTKTAVE